jgi:hypothetical protein
MIQREKLGDAIEILQRHGWRPEDGFMLSDPAIQPKKHSQLFIDASGTECDLHWTPLSAATWPGAELPFWEHSEFLAVRDQVVRVLSPTDQLFHIVVHGGYFNRFPPIRWIADACMILQKEQNRIDWPRLAALGKTYSTTTLLKNGLLYLANEFEGLIPPEVVKEISREQPGWREKIEQKALSRQIPDYRIDFLFMKAWMRHCQKMPNRTLTARIIAFPTFLKVYLAIKRWQDVPSFICQRLGALFRQS